MNPSIQEIPNILYIPARNSCRRWLSFSRHPEMLTEPNSMTLMIVDDNAEVRRLIRRICQDIADTFCECSDGNEALNLYRLQQPDYVVMDVCMEAVNGLTATRQILAAFPAARIVITTRFDDAQMREAARQAGACGFIPKENLLELRTILNAPPVR